MSDTAAPEGGAPQGGDAAEQEARFGLQRIYLKDISFESPRSPEVFRTPWKPRIKLDLNSKSQQLEEDTYEVILTITVEARGEDEQVGYIAELQQAGIFRVAGLDESQLQHTLSSYCPNILFPYARETIDAMVLRGSFPPLMLAPVNFDALYMEALKRRGAGAEAPAQAEAGGDDVTH
ncbi:MAG TPA: protein-export chaperone SecB [Pseudomonadales bacterium]|nr:protein-export chaperone SecB [Pseudomonadales bacterium]